jgi:subtilisin-like proprotein convertase family protein
LRRDTAFGSRATDNPYNFIEDNVNALSKISVATLLASAAVAASAGTYTSAGGAIPDNAPGGPLIVTFAVTEAGPLQLMDLTLTDLTHTWAGDLIVTLTSPNGTVSDIMRRPVVPPSTSTVGDSSNFGGTYRFIDTGADIGVALGGGTTAYILPSGDYMASTRAPATATNSNLMLNAIFAGTPVFGTWTLAISDNAALDTGTLGSATLNISAVPEAGTLAMFGLGLAGLAVGVRRRKA